MTGGILEVENPQSHALCYMRDFEGLDASRLTDANSHRNIDTSKVDGKVSIYEFVTLAEISIMQQERFTHLDKNYETSSE